MASSERGTKRTDPDTGKKFYDLNMDPIVSPYTGKSYPRSFFEQLTGKAGPATARKLDDEDEQDEEDEVENAGPEIVSLEEADAEEAGDDIPDVEDVEVDEDLGDEEDVFLEEDEDEDDGLGFEVSDDEDR
ncbi:TIGR02300 family protein [Devosia faecipullorum]|uniref:TIGR02300 family protein n=1 Tax=Devosia faecipullorum TaxID=2755039 RepID=UPI00187B5212|nr:TIGR02300 family protein [Devosia faecipullorum]MBE7733471.1 TIGR02300 family protein [Devosia faecipullorum]